MPKKTEKSLEAERKTAVGADYPAHLGDENFKPSTLQGRTLHLYLKDEKGLSPGMLIKSQGSQYSLWYKWRKNKKFCTWWDAAITKVYTNERLFNLYNAMYRRALTHDTAAAKIIIQRFDLEFTERSSSDSKHSFPGFTPGNGNAERARERMAEAIEQQKKSVVSKEVSPPNVQHQAEADNAAHGMNL